MDIHSKADELHTLYIVGTPIGNLEDITLRALRILGEVHLIAAEDTRKARVLLQHYQIRTPLTSFFQANEEYKIEVILSALEQGDVALISEAGMPGISDPGYPLIRTAIEHGHRIVVIPGPSAHSAALVISGQPTHPFYFAGFLPRRTSERRAALEALAHLRATSIFYEAPHRLVSTLADMAAVLGDRQVALCRELTKVYEEIWRGTLSQAVEWLQTQPPRGEYTLVVAGAPDNRETWAESAVRRGLAEQLAMGVSRSQAAREIARQSGWARREVYALAMETPD